jgi:hypothetical protein
MAVDTVARLARSWFVATIIAIRGVCKYDDHGLQCSNAYVGRQEQQQHQQTGTLGCAASSALYLPIIYTYARAQRYGSASAHLARGDRLLCQDVYSGWRLATSGLCPTCGSKARFGPGSLSFAETPQSSTLAKMNVARSRPLCDGFGKLVSSSNRDQTTLAMTSRAQRSYLGTLLKSLN